MGFYLRKSVSLGPIRLNFSKSGVGISAGVKGARVGVNAHGQRYVHFGRGGLYFRETFPNSSEPSDEDITHAGAGWLVILLVVGLLIGVAIAMSSNRESPRPIASAVPTMPAAATAQPKATEYIVRAGDNLTAIARKFYGSGDDWPIIYQANRGTLRDPDRLQVGMKLVIPTEGRRVPR